MTIDTAPQLRDLVAVDTDFKPSVQLPFDFENAAINERLVNSFIPTSQSIAILTEIAQSLDPNSTERARSVVGTFGTGKSDLLLMICNYFARQVDDPLMARFYERLREIDPARAGIIRSRRAGQPPFLVVLLQADTVSSFPGFVLHGLQHALEQAGLPQLMDKTRYAAAREQITTWQRENHPRYGDFCKLLEEHEKVDINSLVAALGGPQSDDALSRFRRSFKAVTGSEFNVYGYSQPHEAYATVANSLVSTGRFGGILLVCDEFTAFFERFQSAIDQQLREFEAETKAVENLAERSGSSGRAQIHFMVASLESFASAASGIGSATVAKATERSGGRFKQHSLLVQGSEELIRGAIKRLPAAEGQQLLGNAQRDELLAIAAEVGKLQHQWRDRDWARRTVIEGAFPLHPLTTYALPLLNQRVAQSQRTMFLFLKDDKGLKGFIQREPLHASYQGWQRLLTLDLLFDYFRESITTKRSDIHEAFERAEQQVRTATIGIELALRTLKIVALCETVGSDLVLRPTRLFLRRALNLPGTADGEFDAALELLEQVDAIEAPSEVGAEAGVYRLPRHGWVNTRNLRQRITARAQNLSATDVGRLQATHPPEAVDATEYNNKRNSHRRLSAYYVGLLALRSRERLKADLDDQRNRDGLLWYVVASSDAERAEAQSLARELTGQHARLVVAVPNTPSHILSAFRDYQALEALRRDPELEPVNRPYLEDKGKIGREYRARLDHELSLLADKRQWEWFAAGRGQTVQATAAVTGLASNVIEKVFSGTPNNGLQQHLKPGELTLASPVLKAVEILLKGNVQLPKSAGTPPERVLRVGAVTLGLLQADAVVGAFETFSVAEPTGSSNLASGAIWRRMSEHLAAGKSWAQLVRELRQPPFGLYDSLLVLFTTAFVVRNADSVAIMRNGPAARPAELTASLFKDLLDKPQEFTIRYQLLRESEKRWLRGSVERGLRASDFSLPPGTTLRAAVAGRLKQWLNKLQLPAFAQMLSEAQLAELLPEADTEALETIRRLLRPQPSDGELAALLLNEIPQLLGVPANRDSWDQTTVDALLSQWSAVCDQLARLPVLLKERTVRRAAALFGAEAAAPEQRWTVIFQWRLNHGNIPAGRLQGLANELFRLLNTATGSIEQTLLDDFARRVVTVGVEYQRWADFEKQEKVFAELTRARDEIKRAWEEIAQGDEIWSDGLARLASGRALSSVNAERAAGELAAWSASIAWPPYARSLTAAQLQAIDPGLSATTASDLLQLLRRSDYNQQRWRVDLAETFPRELGIHSWTRGEVTQALKRVEAVLPLAAGLDRQLRRHVLDRAVHLFGASVDAPTDATPEQVLALWRVRFAIPEPNDLSSEAASLIAHVNNAAGDDETLLLVTLPRAIAAVGRPVHQWDRHELLERYIERLAQLIAEIADYQPIGAARHTWLTGALDSIGRPAQLHVPNERRRLTELVAAELDRWLRRQRLPAFVATLDGDELASLCPALDAACLTATGLLLQQGAGARACELLDAELPAAFGLEADDADWDADQLARAITGIEQVARLIEALPEMLQARLLTEIRQIFAPGAEHAAGPLGEMLAWRANYVILPSASISRDARLLYDALGRPDNDPEVLLLQRLPAQVAEVRSAYGNWPTWETRNAYLAALRLAADEIEHHGRVGRASSEAEQLWHRFREQLTGLADDDKRWLLKTFRDEFQP